MFTAIVIVGVAIAAFYAGVKYAGSAAAQAAESEIGKVAAEVKAKL